MARYIDADALYKKLFPLDLSDKRTYTINAKAVADAIDKTPTADVVGVTRCKDCRHSEICPDTLLWCNQYERLTKEDDFCSYGERKE